MIQPLEMKSIFAMKVADDVVSLTTELWNILAASDAGKLDEVMKIANGCPEMLFAQ